MYKNNFLFISDNFIRIQSGFWDISTKIIEIHKIQSIKVYQDIWYKRLNLADLNISTAGGEIRFNFMNDNIIKKLVDTLAYKVEVSKKNWM
jgi:putative membrane protein|tara:strand:+ start:153 stop:425 length:273 start_codon:yes stop_codon:yes gene_type:complete